MNGDFGESIELRMEQLSAILRKILCGCDERGFQPLDPDLKVSLDRLHKDFDGILKDVDALRGAPPNLVKKRIMELDGRIQTSLRPHPVRRDSGYETAGSANGTVVQEIAPEAKPSLSDFKFWFETTEASSSQSISAVSESDLQRSSAASFTSADHSPSPKPSPGMESLSVKEFVSPSTPPECLHLSEEANMYVKKSIEHLTTCSTY